MIVKASLMADESQKLPNEHLVAAGPARPLLSLRWPDPAKQYLASKKNAETRLATHHSCNSKQGVRHTIHWALLSTADDREPFDSEQPFSFCARLCVWHDAEEDRISAQSTIPLIMIGHAV